MLKVGIVGSFAARLEPAIRLNLTLPCQLTVLEEAGHVSRLADMDVLVSMALTREMASVCRHVKLVQVPGAGLDRIDRSAVPAGAWLANAYGHESGIAEYVVGAMLTLTREFPRLDQALRRGEWPSQWAVGAEAPPVWPELGGKTMGILGFGKIGRAVARRVRAFDMKICAVRRNGRLAVDDDVEFLGGPESIDEVICQSDYLLIAIPALPDTIELVNRRRLALMKSTAYLINVARAEIVEEDALYKALAAQAIAGAVLDVWYRYPNQAAASMPANCPFHELPNVLMTPHVAGWTERMMDARGRLIAENIRRLAAGETPLNLVE
jgi:phosphoglycerate dehydrogenase-like enzyme